MFRKKEKNISRNPRINNNDSSRVAYHYSSKRSSTNDKIGRRVVLDDSDSKNDTASKNGRFSDSKKFLSVANLPSMIAIILVLAGVVYMFTLSTEPKIIVINDNAKTQLINKDIIRAKARAELKSSLFYRTKPLFDKTKFADSVKQNSPEVISVDVDISPLRHIVGLKVEFSEPTVILSSSGKQYLIGDSGRVLADVTSDKHGFMIDNLLVVQDQTGFGLDVGKFGLTSSQVDYVVQLKYQAEKAGLAINSAIMQAGGAQLDVRYAATGYYVKYNFFEDARKSSGVFLATKQKLEAEDSTPKEYIDVRVPERAYVK